MTIEVQPASFYPQQHGSTRSTILNHWLLVFSLATSSNPNFTLVSVRKLRSLTAINDEETAINDEETAINDEETAIDDSLMMEFAMVTK